jgi:hypothetical protein
VPLDFKIIRISSRLSQSVVGTFFEVSDDLFGLAIRMGGGRLCASAAKSLAEIDTSGILRIAGIPLGHLVQIVMQVRA